MELRILLVVLVASADALTFGNDQILYLGESSSDVVITEAALGTEYENTTRSESEFHFVYKLKLNSFPPSTTRLKTEIVAKNIDDQILEVNQELLH